MLVVIGSFGRTIGFDSQMGYWAHIIRLEELMGNFCSGEQLMPVAWNARPQAQEASSCNQLKLQQSKEAGLGQFPDCRGSSIRLS